MAKIRIIDGDMELEELSTDFRVVDNFNIDDPMALYPFVTEPFDGVYHDKVIEASANKVSDAFIKWVIQHSVYPVIIFYNGDKPSGLTKSGIKTENVTNNYSFNQTNNSPKSLSRAEIYRDSKNLFSQMESKTT